MTRALTVALALGLAALASGRASGTPKPAEGPPKPAAELHGPRQKEQPRLIAPPPAYGNKVVMASAGQAGAVN